MKYVQVCVYLCGVVHQVVCKKMELHTFVINLTTIYLIVGNVINNLNKTSNDIKQLLSELKPVSTEYLRNGITEHKMASQSS